MKELIKPNNQDLKHLLASLCEIDCACAHVICNKNCSGPAGPNTSIQLDEDLLF